MTTIAYRDGVLAGDTLVTCAGVRVGVAVKVARRGDALAGVCGDHAMTQKLLRWFEGGSEGDPPLPDDDRSEMIVVEAGDLVITYAKSGIDEINAPFYAIGSGRQLAMGAMAMGATAEEAVRAAARLDVYTNDDITVVSRSRVMAASHAS